MEDEDEITLELPPEEEPQEEEPAYITDLKRQLAEEKAGRIRAEQQAHQANRETHRARGEVDETNLQLVVNAIDTVSRDQELMKQAHTYALQNGDFARATEIQSEMSANSAKLLQLENGRQAMENAPRQPEPQMPPTDPVEDFASRLSPRSADWVRKHPEFVRDQRLNAKMIAAHNLAVADGIPTDTDEYFDAIEETLKVTPKPAQNDTDDQYAAKAVRRRDAAPAAAPANRGGQSASSNVVRLSAAEREMAEMMGMKPEDYAKNKVALKKEGKIQ
ncbi:MAG: hypothetical protein DWI31_02200 [Candidatus Aquidulcis sp.]|nr:MAG: hypothetical protein DWI31_02200 [Candidatus Aquidulcis sp.]